MENNINQSVTQPNTNRKIKTKNIFFWIGPFLLLIPGIYFLYKTSLLALMSLFFLATLEGDPGAAIIWPLLFIVPLVLLIFEIVGLLKKKIWSIYLFFVVLPLLLLLVYWINSFYSSHYL